MRNVYDARCHPLLVTRIGGPTDVRQRPRQRNHASGIALRAEQCRSAGHGVSHRGGGRPDARIWLERRSAVYRAYGIESGYDDEIVLYISYILNDFGSYIDWFGVAVVDGAIELMSLRERSLPL